MGEMQASTGELPLCPICCDLLGKFGGVTTLPCGHNGCLDCFAHVQARNPMCPLCRAPFDAQQPLACNYELRDLIQMATSVYMDDTTKEEGWEAFPTAKLMTAHYAHEVRSEQRTQSASNILGYPGARSAANQQPNSHAGPSSSSLLQANSSAGARYLNSSLDDSSSSNNSTGLVQYHEQYHQHPGLPQSAPSGTQRDVLEMEPPQWLPDSYASQCWGCNQAFKPLLRLRHHCRLCGKLFCHNCSKKQLLMPPRFKERDPQRVCDLCANLLEPLQPFLVGATAASVQPPVHDALDAICLRSWFNSPWGSSMGEELYKAANILRCFNQAARLEPERTVPAALLAGAKGLALLSIARLGAGWSCTAGTGIVVSRQRNGSWSAPCAAACYGIGWGLQIGGDLTDVLLVLRTEEAVRAFATGSTLGLGGSAGIAVGPLGRTAEASMRVGGFSARGSVIGYSCSKGAFIGVSLDGSVTCARDAVNKKFYGYAVSARQLLVDCTVPQPPAAAVLFESLDSLVDRWENRGLLLHPKDAVSAIISEDPEVSSSAVSCSTSSKKVAASAASKQQPVQQGHHASSSSHAYQHRQQQQYAEQNDDDIFAVADSMFESAASAPPAPASMLHAYSSSSSRPQHYPQHYPSSTAAARAAPAEEEELVLPSVPTTRVAEVLSDDEEPQYVLEW